MALFTDCLIVFKWFDFCGGETMKRFVSYFLFVSYLLIEIILLGVACYFFVKWDEPIRNGWMDTAHNVIGLMFLVFSIINTIIAYISFSRFTNKYPKNNPNEFCFNPKSSQLGHKGNGNYVIDMKEIEEGVWIAADDQGNLKFDMRGYIFPKLYICTYFIRNLHYSVMNKNKYPLIKLFKSMKLNPYTKYQNVEICFSYSGKIYRRKIVVGNKTKTTLLMRLIMRSKYYIDFMFGLSYGELRKTHMEISEEKYINSERH